MAPDAPSVEDIAWRAMELAERRANRAVARMVVQACREDDVELFREMLDAIPFAIDGWASVLRAVSRLPSVPPAIQIAFQSVWIEAKTLPRRVGHRPTVAAALRLLIAQNYQGGELTLYRGAGASERRRRLYGFSWTTRPDVADEFAREWMKAPGGGVILKTVAPADAILWQREEGMSFDESEVVVDPYRLGRVSVYHRHAGTDAGSAGGVRAPA